MTSAIDQSILLLDDCEDNGESNSNFWIEELDSLNLLLPDEDSDFLSLRRSSTVELGDIIASTNESLTTSTPTSTLSTVASPSPNVTTASSSSSSEPVKKTNQAKSKTMTKEEKLKKRRAAVALASRNTRAKRKKELEDLRLESIKHQKEKEDLLKTINDLKLLVSQQRSNGSINLKTENDLLRNELKDLKQFVRNFQKFVTNIPDKHDSNKLQSIKRGAENASNMALGIYMTSLKDKNYKNSNLIQYPELDLKYLRLPHNSTAATANRLNYRFVVPYIPISVDDFLKTVWKTYTDPQILQSNLSHLEIEIAAKEVVSANIKKDIIIESDMLSNATASDVEESIEDGMTKVIYFREESKNHLRGKPKDRVDILSCRKQIMPKFPDVVTGLNEEDVELWILSSNSITNDTAIVDRNPGVCRIDAAVMESNIIQVVDDGIRWIIVGSTPVDTSGEGNGVPLGFCSNSGPIIDDDGQLKDAWVKYIDGVLDVILEGCNETTRAKLKEYYPSLCESRMSTS